MSLTIVSRVIGELRQDQSLDDWWEGPKVPIPLFDQLPLKITFTGLPPDETLDFLLDADITLSNFLNIGPELREQIAPLVWQNCKDFLEAIGYDEQDKTLWEIKEANQIWNFVEFQDVYLERRHRRDRGIYVRISGACEWEQEHGLQLVFRQGKKLTRVSTIDGSLTEADAYNKPDAQDDLLSAF